MTEVIAPAETSPEQPTVRLTPSMLFYAYAHKVASKAGLTDRKKAVPCAGPDVFVSQDSLARALVHAAFWDLQRRGKIRLEEVERKVLFVKTRSLKVRVADSPGGTDSQLSDEVPDSLEYNVLKAAVRERGDGDVRDVVRAMYGKDVEDPYRRVMAFANVAEIASGLVVLRTEEHHGIGKLRGGKKETLVWQCDQVGAHVKEFNAVVADWNRDHDADVAAFDRLHHEIDLAIASRKVRERESLLEMLEDD